MSDGVKVILDTDIGSDIDDAVALAYLLSQPRCDLLGITTVSADTIARAQMASAICRHVDRDDVPIHAGASQAIASDMPQMDVPQAAAMKDWPCRKDFAPGSAVEFIRNTIRANPGEITLLAIGPFTNVGLLFATDPQLPEMLKSLVIMGGRFFQDSPADADREWNALNDPLATKIVFGGGKQAKPPQHVSFGIDVTMACQLPPEKVRDKFTAKVLEPVRDFAEVWFKERDTLVFHDPLAAACIFQPDICSYVEGRVTVQADGEQAGKTTFAEIEGGPHTVAKTVDTDAFFEHFFSVVK
jgi:inosine-uridine nucleoside N-ribohydrolase